jgi:hypothetical protein
LDGLAIRISQRLREIIRKCSHPIPDRVGFSNTSSKFGIAFIQLSLAGPGEHGFGSIRQLGTEQLPDILVVDSR